MINDHSARRTDGQGNQPGAEDGKDHTSVSTPAAGADAKQSAAGHMGRRNGNTKLRGPQHEETGHQIGRQALSLVQFGNVLRHDPRHAAGGEQTAYAHDCGDGENQPLLMGDGQTSADQQDAGDLGCVVHASRETDQQPAETVEYTDPIHGRDADRGQRPRRAGLLTAHTQTSHGGPESALTRVLFGDRRDPSCSGGPASWLEGQFGSHFRIRLNTETVVSLQLPMSPQKATDGVQGGG